MHHAFFRNLFSPAPAALKVGPTSPKLRNYLEFDKRVEKLAGFRLKV
jgi:hypothetical protein